MTGTNTGGADTADSDPSSAQAVQPITTANTSLPQISGIVRQGEVLTASQRHLEGTQPLTYSLPWKRCDPTCNTTVATSSSYAPAAADVGNRLELTVTATGPAARKRRSVLTRHRGAAPGHRRRRAAPRRRHARPGTTLRKLSPFPVDRDRRPGDRAAGCSISLLRVSRAPRGSVVTVTCRGRGCPFRRARRTVRRRAGLRIRGLERRLRAGTVITIIVRKGNTIGKYTRLRIRRGAPPARIDRCIRPGAQPAQRLPMTGLRRARHRPAYPVGSAMLWFGGTRKRAGAAAAVLVWLAAARSSARRSRRSTTTRPRSRGPRQPHRSRARPATGHFGAHRLQLHLVRCTVRRRSSSCSRDPGPPAAPTRCERPTSAATSGRRSRRATRTAAASPSPSSPMGPIAASPPRNLRPAGDQRRDGFAARRSAPTPACGAAGSRAIPPTPSSGSAAPPPPPRPAPDITGARAARYTSTASDVGRHIRVVVGAEGLGRAQVASRTLGPVFVPAAAATKRLTPFPVLVIVGRLRGSTTRITEFVIRAPRRARVSVRCKGRRCPFRRVARPGRQAQAAARSAARSAPSGPDRCSRSG